MFKNIIFDWSGVISDSIERHLKVVNKMFNDFGVQSISMEELKENWEQPYMRFYTKYMPGVTLEEEQLAYANAFLESGKCNPHLGMIELIKKLKINKKKLIVISSDITESLFSEIKDFGLEEVFLEVVTNVHDKTESLIKIIDRENFKSEETVFIGDSNHEIEEGKQAGVKTIAVTWGFSTESKLVALKPDFLVNTVKELEKCLLG